MTFAILSGPSNPKPAQIDQKTSTKSSGMAPNPKRAYLDMKSTYSHLRRSFLKKSLATPITRENPGTARAASPIYHFFRKQTTVP
jgi:hypothetical protein